MQLRWQSMHKKMKESSINDYLKLLEPLLTEDEIEPELFRLAAATHERHAAWLVDQHKDASDALTKGFGMVSQAFKRNPHMPGAFATRGDLYLVEARVAKDSKSRTIAAKQAKESFDSALHYNQYLAWETEAARKEVEQILNPTDSNGQ
jgi:hypothetical protein